VSEILSEPVGVLALIAAAIAALGVIWRQAIRPVIHGVTRIQNALVKVESQTRQLSPNGGSHMRDDITEIRRVVERQTEDMATVKTALESEARKVRRELTEHQRDTAEGFEEVWRSLAVRDIYRAVDVIEQVADKVNPTPEETP
jgi:hypothetical protein